MKLLRQINLAGVPLMIGLISVIVGRDANWDFLNYRWYNSYALLHGRLTFDILVAEHATFYNPFLELPFYLIATHFPAIVAGFFVAVLGGLGFIPLYLIVEQIFPLGTRRTRILVPTLLGLAGFLGGGVLGQIGIVSWDVPLATLTLLAILIIVSDDAKALGVIEKTSVRRLLLAGLLSGAAAGLKLTAAVYPVGLVVAIFFAAGPSLRERLVRSFIFSLGVVTGVLLLGGYWMWRLYEAFGNPTFPYFNGLFHSAFAAAGSNRDTSFLPEDWRTALFFPILFSQNSLLVAEYHFRDIHIALVYLLILLTVVWAVVRQPAQSWVKPVTKRFLLIAFSVSFVVWEALFSIYRYILPLEMLAPIVIVTAIDLLPLSLKLRMAIAIVSLLICQAAIQVGFNRRGWDANYVNVELPFAIPPTATLLLTGGAPMGFAVTAFPESVPALRIDSYLAKDNHFTSLLAQRVNEATGPLYVLYARGDETVTDTALKAYGLEQNSKDCRSVVSNVSDPLMLCPVVRQ